MVMHNQNALMLHALKKMTEKYLEIIFFHFLKRIFIHADLLGTAYDTQ